MKKILFIFLLCPLLLKAQPNSTTYLIENVFINEVDKIGNCYVVDSSFFYELVLRAYPNDWYIPIKRNLDIYGPRIFGDYKFFLTESYGENGLAVGNGHYFDEEGRRIAFSIIFVLDEKKEAYYFIHFCQSKNEKLPEWEYLDLDNIRCDYSHSILSAGGKKNEKRKFY